MIEDPIKILLIEDDEEDYYLLKAWLSKIKTTNYALDWVSTFEKGLEAISGKGHDVYLVDYRLGAKDGLELIRCAIKEGYNFPFILITGQGDREVDMDALRTGASDYLNKDDITPSLLEHTIRYAIERKRVEEELLHAKKKAEEATALKDKFVSLVAHDLRGPLGTIPGLLNLVMKDEGNPISERQAHILDTLINSSRNMLEMIEQILDISMLRTGKITLRREWIDVHEVAARLVDVLDYLARKKDIGIKNEIPGNTMIYADPKLIGQVLQNLVSNAIKFTDRGGKVTLSAPKDKSSTIVVADTGRGMKKKFMADIFKHEVKTSTIGTEGERGTGLGLPLSHDIVKAHGGSLAVESREGEGSTFFMELPYDGARQ